MLSSRNTWWIVGAKPPASPAWFTLLTGAQRNSHQWKHQPGKWPSPSSSAASLPLDLVPGPSTSPRISCDVRSEAAIMLSDPLLQQYHDAQWLENLENKQWNHSQKFTVKIRSERIKTQLGFPISCIVVFCRSPWTVHWDVLEVRAVDVSCKWEKVRFKLNLFLAPVMAKPLIFSSRVILHTQMCSWIAVLLQLLKQILPSYGSIPRMRMHYTVCRKMQAPVHWWDVPFYHSAGQMGPDHRGGHEDLTVTSGEFEVQPGSPHLDISPMEARTETCFYPALGNVFAFWEDRFRP